MTVLEIRVVNHLVYALYPTAQRTSVGKELNQMIHVRQADAIGEDALDRVEVGLTRDRVPIRTIPGRGRIRRMQLITGRRKTMTTSIEAVATTKTEETAITETIVAITDEEITKAVATSSPAQDRRTTPVPETTTITMAVGTKI